jgi:glyoxylase-like metal-dependent hydrolase (beta-lactamase superfamily II)
VPVEVTLLTAGACTHPGFVIERGAGRRPVEFPALVAVIRHPEHGVILFDTGYTERFAEQTARLPGSLYRRTTPVTCTPDRTAVAQLALVGIDPDEVRWVIISHFHADHVAGLRDFPRAQLVFSQEALAPLRRSRSLRQVRHGFLPGLMPEDVDARTRHVEDLPRAAVERTIHPDLPRSHELFGDGSVVVVGLPGHAPGHVGLLVRTEHAEVLLAGDACWTRRAFTHLLMPHPVARLVTHSWRTYRVTLRALHDLHVRRPDLLIVPSHCAESIATAEGAL